MKHTSKTILAAIVGISTVLPFAAGVPSQETSGMKHENRERTGAISLHRVEESTVEARLTAKDVIGKAVHGIDGEKLGDVADIALSGFSDDLEEGLRMTSRSDDRPATSATSARSSTAGALDDAVVFISVGGMFGIGDDLVSVPAAALSYDTDERHFTLNVRKADFVALAEQKLPTYAAERDRHSERPVITTGDNKAAGSIAGSPAYPGWANTSAKMALEDDVVAVRQAIRSDPDLGDAGSRVVVTVDGKEIVISGTASSEAERRKIIAVARANTDKPIKDSLKVSDR